MPIIKQYNNVTVYGKLPGEDSETICNSVYSAKDGYGVVYRLDKPVGGIILLAKRSFDGEIVSKKYSFICTGRPEADVGEFHDFLYHDPGSNRTFPVKRMRKGVKEALLHYELQSYDKGSNMSLVTAVIQTGRTHQIRAQFASRRMPLAGDGKYGSRIKCPIALCCAEVVVRPSVNAAEERFVYGTDDIYPWNIFAEAKRG